MAPSRGKGKAAAKGSGTMSARGGRRRTRSGAHDVDDDVPDVYRSMLAEADAAGSNDDGDRPFKKRRVATATSNTADRETVSSPGPALPAPHSAAKAHGPPVSSLQTVEASSEPDGSDFEFEDVDLDGPTEEPVDGIEDLSISVQPESNSKRPALSRRKPASIAEKAQRLLVHKMHVLCLLGHCMYVNGRCNNTVAQKYLRKLLSSKTISYLNPKTEYSQFQRNRSFMDGLQQAMDSFDAEYRPISAGLIRPQWRAEGEEGKTFDTIPTDKSDFLAAAQSLEGTQDMGAQLFCAMLRSAGVDARIVCSLQVLPYASGAKPPTPKKPAKEIVHAVASYDSPSKSNRTIDDTAITGSSTIGKIPSARRRLGQPSFAAASASKPSTTPKKKARPAPKLSFPVFWVEAFNEAQQKWVPIDPIVTHTVNKPAKLEPPSSYEYNQLLYAIAFEDDGSARDVTRRYAKAYNAKTRRHRVEGSSEGAKWFKKVMRFFRRRGGALDQDQVEDAELAQKEAKEGMPANVLDFKDHPYYALERHLKRHEVIYPRRDCGKVNAGTAAKPRIEAVFRRNDVLVCRSADKWYRIGREIKEGEQPLKHVPARARRARSVDDDEDGDAASTTALYAPHQTQLYVPPPVQKGRIPKNVYGNLDVYTSSMVPAGGVHIRHALAQRAAKLLKVDYADAVTGFKFQGRHGTAIMEGVVVAQQFEAAVKAVINGFQEEQLEDENRARSLLALKVWKRFLTGLRIRERVESYGDGSKQQDVEEDEEEAPFAGFFAGALVDNSAPLTTAGKYTIEELMAPTPKQPPAKKKRVVHDDESDEEFAQVSDEEGEYEAGGFFPGASMKDDVEIAGGFLPEAGGGFLPAEDEDGRGGGFLAESHEPGDGGIFIPGDGGYGGGGFLPDENDGTGGGFLLDTDQDDPTDILPQAGQHGGIQCNEAGSLSPHERHDDGGGGFVTEQDEQDEQADKDDHDDHDDHNDDFFGEDESAEREHELPESHSCTEPDGSHAAPAKSDIVDTAMANSKSGAQDDSGDDEVEKGSLPSHDSEDEDAEPDWLDSD